MNDARFQKKLAKEKKRGEQYKQLKEVRDEYAEYVPEHKKRKVSNILLVISVIAIVAYVVADWFLQFYTGMELSPTITPYWFAFFTSELFLLAGIKITKVIREPYDNEEDCR